MPSRTEVAQAALDKINVPVITDLDGTDSKSQRCKRIYDFHLDIMLEKDDWQFAKRHQSVAVDADVSEAVTAGWLYSYTIPPDCRKPIRINNCDDIPWTVVGNKIYTDQAAPIVLEFISATLANDPNKWHANFREMFTAYLAKEYAKAFPQNQKAAELEYQEYANSRGEVMAKEGSLGSVHRPDVPALTTHVRRF